MATKAISGMELWHNTELGKALAKVLPPQLTRVIIDIPVYGAVKIYYASIETGPTLDLKWDEIIERVEVVKPKEAACCLPSDKVWKFNPLDEIKGKGDFKEILARYCKENNVAIVTKELLTQFQDDIDSLKEKYKALNDGGVLNRRTFMNHKS